MLRTQRRRSWESPRCVAFSPYRVRQILALGHEEDPSAPLFVFPHSRVEFTHQITGKPYSTLDLKSRVHGRHHGPIQRSERVQDATEGLNMLSVKPETVFIIGAGFSRHAGLPITTGFTTAILEARGKHPGPLGS